MSTIPMTQYGAELLRSELEHLKTVARHEVIAEIAEARAHGDLKENAEYHAAKEKQAFIEGRIREIEDKLSRSRIIDISGIPCDGKVIFGSVVKLNHLENEIEVTYRIVGDDEADLKQNKISVSSPIARAIIGKYVGEEVAVTTPQGEFTYEIIAVEYV